MAKMSEGSQAQEMMQRGEAREPHICRAIRKDHNPHLEMLCHRTTTKEGLALLVVGGEEG